MTDVVGVEVALVALMDGGSRASRVHRLSKVLRTIAAKVMTLMAALS